MIMKKEYYCFVCDSLLTKANASIEHVILNSCGGRLKSKRLLCRECNSKMGEDADAELAKQLAFFSTFLNIGRERGNLQPIGGFTSKDGERYTMLPGKVNEYVLSKPDVQMEKTAEGTKYSYTASDTTSLDSFFKGLARKHPGFDLEQAKKEVKRTRDYFSESLRKDINIGGPLVFRSVVKACVEFFILAGGDPTVTKPLVQFVLGLQEMDVIWIAPLDSPPYELADSEVSHFLYVKADSSENIAYGYVDYFNAYPYLVCLSDDYNGPDFEATYCFDLLKAEKIEKGFNRNLSRAEVLQLARRRQPAKEEFYALNERLQRTFSIAERKQIDNYIEKMFMDSFRLTRERLGNPETLTELVIEEFADEFAKNYVAFQSHLEKKKKRKF
jgi:hypothetical protein